MNREVYEDAIERTPEYEAFMAELEELHSSRGRNFHISSREPELGGKKLDIMRIYKWVMEVGGSSDATDLKVTQDRGWKKISIPFNLPSTWTHSVFVVKQAYHRNLLAYSMFEQNAKFLTQHASVITMIAKCMALPSQSMFIEMKMYCLDIFESLAFHVKLRGKGEFYLCLTRLAFESDSPLILGSGRLSPHS
ncbi:ARID DNA-binding domain-containing protein [Cladochytrium replicatum]|nr:ARID DNA-binding domain-containing protein [Cladochytrium replicatum]